MKKKKRTAGIIFGVTLGAILICTVVLAVFVLKDQRAGTVTDIKEYRLFWFILVSLFLWIVSLIWYTVVALRMRRFVKRLKSSEETTEQVALTFSRVIDSKDEYAKGHSERVADYAVILGKKQGLNEAELKQLKYSALLHNSGMISVPSAILMKPDRLSDEERAIMESHTTYGSSILEGIDNIPGIKECALYHHERYDGKGYPKGIKGNKIPLFARIVAVADAFDAMQSDRVYRKRLPREEILRELNDNSGMQFDPDIVRNMTELINDGTIKLK